MSTPALFLRNAFPPKLGLLGLSMELYLKVIPGTIPKFEAFHQTLAETLEGMGEVVAHALCYTRQDVEKAVAAMEAGGAEVLVVAFQSYHPSLNALSALIRTRLPLLLWNTQKLQSIGPNFSSNDLNENHGMHGVQDLCSCLKRAGRAFCIVSGHYEDPEHLAEVDVCVRVCGAASLSRRLRVGSLGPPLEGMGDFLVNATEMQSQWGPSVQKLSLADLGDHVQAASEEQVEEAMAFDHARFDFSPDISVEDHRRSARLTVALRELAGSRGLHAFTQHFGIYGGDPRIETCPFLGINHLIADGVGYAGEGDVLTASLAAVLSHVFGRSGFCEMFTADFEKNRVFFSHMCEGNYTMARADRKPLLKKLPYSYGKGSPYLVPVFTYAPGPSTFVNIAPNGNAGFRLVVFEGEVTDWSGVGVLKAPHFIMQASGKLGALLDAYSLEGGTHHLVRVEGHQTGRLRHLARMLNMDFTVI